jgi:hypothetical protein
VANTGNRPIDGSIQFRAKRTFVQAWDPNDDRLLQEAAGNHLPLTLAPYESRVFILHDLDANPDGHWSEILPPLPEIVETERADLSTGWQIRFAGVPAPQDLNTLASWTEIPGRQFFSGEAVYTRNFTIDANLATKARSALYLDFGAGTPFEDKRRPGASGMMALLDPPIREAAVVFVNGKRAGSLWHPPYRIGISDFVHPGENQVEVHVYDTAINLLAGQPPRDYSALRAKYGRRFDPQDMDNLKPIPSGLLGPIHLIEQRHK